MDKGTFASYGWIVITVVVIAIMIAFASPFGDFVVDGVKDAMTNFESTATEELAKERDNVKFDGAGSGGGGTPTPQVYELSGVWTFNATAEYPADNLSQYINFTCDSTQWFGFYYDNGTHYYFDANPQTDLPSRLWDFTDTIDFGSTPQEVSPEFYAWFTVNATQQ